jgi:hypothetical protein
MSALARPLREGARGSARWQAWTGHTPPGRRRRGRRARGRRVSLWPLQEIVAEQLPLGASQ